MRRFSVKGEGIREVEVELVHFDRFISSDDAVKEMDNMGFLRPATHEEILSFGAKYPDMQRKFPIVALGSFAQAYGHRGVLYLLANDAERELCFDWWDRGWGDDCRFLAVRK